MFHVPRRITKLVPKAHGARPDFVRALSDAFYKVDKLTFAARKAKLLSRKGWTQTMVDDTIKFDYAKFIKKGVVRHIPEPCELLARFWKVIHTYGGIEDAATGVELLSPKAWKEVDKIAKTIARGGLSDMPGENMYVYYHLVSTSALTHSLTPS